METGWIMEMFRGAGMLFIHPLFYYSFLLAILVGYRRVKRERKDFKIRVEGGLFELKNVLPLGLLVGLILSVACAAAGIVVPFAAILLMAVVAFVISFTMQFRLLSPAYIIGITLFLVFFLFEKNIDIPYFGAAIDDLNSPLVPGLAVIMGAMLIAEGLMVRINASKKTSPRLITSNRGLTVGAHETGRIWLVPLFLFLPGGDVSLPFEWWPVFHLGEQMTVTPILVPFILGYTQLVQAALPEQAIKTSGAKVIGLGVIVLAAAVASIWIPLLSIIAAAMAILVREFLYHSDRNAEIRSTFYFTNKDHGVFILGIIPGSPAYKMGLQVGEVITKVNGKNVISESELYEALQTNRAHCKLEVLDTSGEVRLVQKAVYQGEHHELGILFIPEKTAVSMVS
ncbi:PDZ domain-containing protein [Bacillus sp. AGMB 02131]|uniref:PDZ domain-containing protein n=1 Tax=Peribacillus faecalis TaxID=2772559 RepID=A0A927HBK2_9BACI|nr:PDZ domain-containing protein [Peribacillus faecalis]MBD3108591.1 PDZ domain-containing protein [Peribacillus faecalis]